MQVNSVFKNQNFGMAKIVNKTKVWNVAIDKMGRYKSSNDIMVKNLECIEQVYPNKYLHTYEFGSNVTFKISSIKNHFLAYIFPATLKYKDSYQKNTPIGIFTLLKLNLEKIVKNKV